jgi:hypothetical protein
MHDQALQSLSLKIVRALDEVERIGRAWPATISVRVPRDDARWIDEQKLQVIRLLLELRRAAGAVLQLPLMLRTGHFFSLDAAREAPDDLSQRSDVDDVSAFDQYRARREVRTRCVLARLPCCVVGPVSSVSVEERSQRFSRRGHDTEELRSLASTISSAPRDSTAMRPPAIATRIVHAPVSSRRWIGIRRSRCETRMTSRRVGIVLA